MNFILKTVKQIHIIETNKRVFHEEKKKQSAKEKINAMYKGKRCLKIFIITIDVNSLSA